MGLGSQHAAAHRDALGPAARVRSAAEFAIGTFGPLLAFWIGQHFWGTLIGVAGAVVWSAGNVVYRLGRGKPMSRLFWLTTVLTLAFGALDLAIGKSVFFRFEAVLTNLLTALYFGLSIATGKSVLEEIYEKSQGAATSQTAELKAYLRLFTAVWSGYFLLKAGLYCWLALVLPLARLMFVRSIVGNASLLALFGTERMLRVRLFRYLKAHGCLGARYVSSSTPG